MSLASHLAPNSTEGSCLCTWHVVCTGVVGLSSNRLNRQKHQSNGSPSFSQVWECQDFGQLTQVSKPILYPNAFVGWHESLMSTILAPVLTNRFIVLVVVGVPQGRHSRKSVFQHQDRSGSKAMDQHDSLVQWPCKTPPCCPQPDDFGGVHVHLNFYVQILKGALSSPHGPCCDHHLFHVPQVIGSG